MKEINNKKFNIFLGDQLNKISNLPTTQRISNELFSSKNISFEKSNSLLRNIQLLLDNVVYEKEEIFQKLLSLFEARSNTNTSFYKSIIDESFVSSIIYMNYDYLFEDNFSAFIKKSTPFHINNSENTEIPFYKIWGDYREEDACIYSTQNLKKVKMLDFYKEFWLKIKNDLKKYPTILLGINLGDSIVVDTLDYIFTKEKKEHRKNKQIYLYANKLTEDYLENSEIKDFIKKHSIKIIKGENEEFLNTFKTYMFEANNTEEFIIVDDKNEKDNVEEKQEEEKEIEVVELPDEEIETVEENQVVEDSKLPIFEKDTSEKIVLESNVDLSEKIDTKVIDVTSMKEAFIETKTEIDFKTFFLNKFPIKFKNFSNNLIPTQVINLGLVDIDFGFEKQNAMAVKIIDYPSFRLIEMRRRDFKIAIGVDLNSAICLKANSYYEYEIYRGSKNIRLEWIFNFMINLFEGCNIKFHASNFMFDLRFENYLEHSKFTTLNKIFVEYKSLVKILKLYKNKNFSDLNNSFYQIHLLENSLKSKNYNSWINTKIKLSLDNIVDEGDKLIIKRKHRYYLKNLSYDLIEILSLIEPIKKSEIQGGYLILKRKNVEVELKKISK